MAQVPRPSFTPVPCKAEDSIPPLQLDPLSEIDKWVPICTCPADFPLELFQAATYQLIHHPEYNSTLILRSETISESEISAEFPPELPRIQGLLPVKNIHRKLLPRRPGRDAPIDQHCTLYRARSGNYSPEPSEPAHVSCLILTPLVPPGQTLPYYHPAVSHLAFRYLMPVVGLDSRMESASGSNLPSPAHIRIEVIPLAHTTDLTDLNSRIYRTCLALLETIHRYGWGAMTSYKKRVIHDALVPREIYQDLYLIMRERYKHLVDDWKEATDPLKHVFEDIGIATFLMLLWKETFGSDEQPSMSVAQASEHLKSTNPNLELPPWHNWPRPPGGFLDIGCGNGLLSHILVSEGYTGEGIDVRARTSWAHYPESTQSHLHVHAFDPTSSPSIDSAKDAESHTHFLTPGVFIIANHADELTPWAPVISTLYSASGYLSIPCCSWAFDAKFERSHTQSMSSSNFPIVVKDTSKEFIESLNLGGDGSNKSSYSIYRIWLARLSVHCGWEIECETLRIPSTRNWALIGRKRKGASGVSDSVSLENAREIVRVVRERGVFKARRPEGKAGDH